MISNQRTQNVPFYTSFLRYNATAMTASVCDFGTMIFLREVVGLYYVIATFFGALCGGTVAFVLGRNWTYLSKDEKPQVQGLRYFFVWGGNILLNTYGVYFFSEIVGFGEEQYIYSRVLTACLVGALYNFPLQRYFVFR